MNPDAILIVSFGGPEGMNDVMPFLENVLRGKNVPEERKKEVAQHYEMFGGISPINQQNRELKKLLEIKLREEGLSIPVFWGNRNWKPYIKDALIEMKADGIQNVIAYVTSAYGSYSGCRQYSENIEHAREDIGEGAPVVHKIPAFYNHPNFAQVNAEQIQKELQKIPLAERKNTNLIFTAHSIPISMSEVSPYVKQLQEVCETVAEKTGFNNWKLAFQSRSGPPTMPWLEPDINDYLEVLARKNVRTVIVSPIGFLSDHMEVLYDLDIEAKKKSQKLGIQMFRASTPGNHPLMIEMIVDLIKLQIKNGNPIVCDPHCCKK